MRMMIDKILTSHESKLDAARGPSGGQLLLNECKTYLDPQIVEKRPEGRITLKICSGFPPTGKLIISLKILKIIN